MTIETLHEHDENCECGCHDEHHREPEHHHHEHKPIMVTTHDMSVVGSYKFSIERPYNESVTILDNILKDIAKEITDHNGIIGHIKAFLSSGGKSCMISITEDESNKRIIESSRSDIEGVAIVFNITPEQLENTLKKAFETYINE